MVVSVFSFESGTVWETGVSRCMELELVSGTAASEGGATDRLVTNFDVEAVVGAVLLRGTIS